LPSLLGGKVNLADKGLPFDRIKVVFSIENETLTFKKIMIDGPVLEIGGAGSYRLGQDDMNIVLAVSPVASYSKLLRNAPLLGKLFVGEEDGLLGALFEVKGPRQNPSVRYMPLQQLSKTLTGIPALAVNVLKNAIMLPKEMLTPTKQAR
jgi:AsmA-like protein